MRAGGKGVMGTRAVVICEKILKFCLTGRDGEGSIHVSLFTAFVDSHCFVIHNLRIVICQEPFGCFLIKRSAD